MIIEILLIANEGTQTVIPFDPDDSLAAKVNACRQPENRTVCIVQDGRRIMRWDRPTAGSNRWRRVRHAGPGQ